MCQANDYFSLCDYCIPNCRHQQDFTPEDIYPWSFHDEILIHNSAIFQPVIFNPIKTRLHNTDHTIRTREYKDYSNHWKKPRKRERGGQLEANSFNLIALLHWNKQSDIEHISSSNEELLESEGTKAIVSKTRELTTTMEVNIITRRGSKRRSLLHITIRV